MRCTLSFWHGFAAGVLATALLATLCGISYAIGEESAREEMGVRR